MFNNKLHYSYARIAFACAWRCVRTDDVTNPLGYMVSAAELRAILCIMHCFRKMRICIRTESDGFKRKTYHKKSFMSIIVKTRVGGALRGCNEQWMHTECGYFHRKSIFYSLWNHCECLTVTVLSISKEKRPLIRRAFVRYRLQYKYEKVKNSLFTTGNWVNGLKRIQQINERLTWAIYVN